MVSGINNFLNSYINSSANWQAGASSQAGGSNSMLSFGSLTFPRQGTSSVPQNVDYSSWTPESLREAQARAISGVGVEPVNGSNSVSKVHGSAEAGSLQDFKTNFLQNCDPTNPVGVDQYKGVGLNINGLF